MQTLSFCLLTTHSHRSILNWIIVSFKSAWAAESGCGGRPRGDWWQNKQGKWQGPRRNWSLSAGPWSAVCPSVPKASVRIMFRQTHLILEVMGMSSKWQTLERSKGYPFFRFFQPLIVDFGNVRLQAERGEEGMRGGRARWGARHSLAGLTRLPVPPPQ